MTNQQQTADPQSLWAAVDVITSPTSRKLDRDTESEWRAAVEAELPWLLRAGTVCSVTLYRAAVDRLRTVDVAYGQIPPLWDQAEWAMTTGSEKSEGGSSPLRERSPADLDLMETMLTIRESLHWQLAGRNITPKPGVKAQLRQLAAHVVTHEPQHIAWWTYRIQQWGRLLSTHLDVLDRAPKPVHLRNAPCPLCKTRQVTVEQDGEKKVVPAILIDFTDGWIRAAQCQACGHAWFRGDDLGELANLLDSSDLSERITA